MFKRRKWGGVNIPYEILNLLGLFWALWGSCVCFLFSHKRYKDTSLLCQIYISIRSSYQKRRQAVYLEIVDITWGLSSLDNMSLAFSSQVLNSHILVSSSAQSGCRLTTRSGGPDPNSIWQRRNPFGGESPQLVSKLLGIFVKTARPLNLCKLAKSHSVLILKSSFDPVASWEL